MLESLDNNIAGLNSTTLFKKRPTQMFSCEYCEIFKNNYFEKYLRTATSNRAL